MSVRMSAYRFCRTDDIGLLVDALNRCWAPHFPGEPPTTPASFKRSIRDLQVWCSSCMVAFSGSDPIGVLIGAKRPSGTLIHKIAVHPDHVRQGHGRHLLTSLGSKLAILGPPRMVAEVQETFDAACGLFSACGYVEEAVLTDYVSARRIERGDAARARRRFLIPVTVDDLAANGILGEPSPLASAGQSVRCAGSARSRPSPQGKTTSPDWPSPPTSESRLTCCTRQAAEIVSLRSFVEDGGARLKQLLAQLHARGMETFRFPKVHPAEFSKESLEALGFRPAGGYRLYAATPRQDSGSP